MNPKPTLLLIDGHSLAFRAFYALNPDNFRTPDGQYTNAVHGFISMMLNLLEGEKPSHLAVAFDLSGPTFRTEEHAEYKGTRGETPVEFLGQTELIQQAMQAMNIRTLTRVNYEADDILASLADQAAESGYKVLVVSGDRDTFQLIGENTTILYPVKGVMNLARMDDEAVVAKYGIHAKQYPDLAALVGETSDNLIGIPGVGPKTAAKWLQQYENLDGVISAKEEIGGKVGESLRENIALAIRNRRLNHLVRDLDMGIGFDEMKLGPVNEQSVREVFAAMNFKTLTERVLRLRGVNGSQTNGVSKPKTNSVDAPESADPVKVAFEKLDIPNPSYLSEDELLRWLNQQDLVGLEVESIDSNLIFGFASKNERHVCRNLSPTVIEKWLLDEKAKKALFDYKGTRKLLLEAGLEIQGVEHDVLLLAYLLNPVRRNYYVDDICVEYLGISVTRSDANQLIPDGSDDVSLDAWIAVSLCMKMFLEVQATKQDFVYREIELVTAETLAEMEHTGIRVDREKLEKLFEILSKEVASIAKQAFEIIGHEINLASPKQLQTVLFDELGMTGTKALKTGFSTNAATLTELYELNGHPFLEKLLEHRDSTKLRQMVETLLKAVETDNRIHTNYVQTGTSTGRLSSENPNLQNIPIKNPRGSEIRDSFIVTPGFETLLTADYSQIEMRIMAHLSEDEGLIQAFREGEDLHRFVGARIFGVEPEAVTALMRSKVKAMSYGLVYGLSEYGLAKQLRISNAEAKQLMSDYFARFGGVRRYLAKVVEEAKNLGYTTTIHGRRRPFDDLNSKIFQVRENARRAALNAPIQGTAADIMKIAMNSIQREISKGAMKSRMLLQVHDELVFEVAEGELQALTKLVVEKMSNVIELSVPLEVQIGIGKSWDQAGH